MRGVLEAMQPLLRQARDEGKWLYTNYQCLWFSPDELEAEHGEGRFLWGPENWALRNPEQRITEFEHEIERAKTNLATFKQRVIASQESGT